MKKLLILLCIAFITVPIFALPEFTMSAGGGGVFSTQWKFADLRPEYKDYAGAIISGYPAPTEKTQDAMRQGYFDTDELSFAGGIWGFFDATYVEADMSLIFTSYGQTVKMPNLPNLSSSLNGPQKHRYTITQMNLTILGKYPISLNDKLTVFPLLGIDWQIALYNNDGQLYEDFKIVKAMGYDVPNLGEFWNCFWIKTGVGADYSITNNLYVRGEFLYGIKLNSKNDTDNARYWAENLKGVANGPSVKFGIGYRFF
jgi:opacity protein-like surface antigen